MWPSGGKGSVNSVGQVPLSAQWDSYQCQQRAIITSVDRAWQLPVSTQRDSYRCRHSATVTGVDRVRQLPVSTECDKYQYQDDTMKPLSLEHLWHIHPCGQHRAHELRRSCTGRKMRTWTGVQYRPQTHPLTTHAQESPYHQTKLRHNIKLN